LPLRKTIEEITSGLTSEPIENIEVEVPEEMVLLSDRSALERITGNLVTNALVHGAPPVSIQVAIDGGAARISVADRGLGIPEAFLGRLYDPFARASDAEGKPGVGLGLSIAQAYARRLGGELVYEQARPNGAIFTLVLPQPVS
jgi:two-component system, OmpR family, sensor histidine kinase MtrB